MAIPSAPINFSVIPGPLSNMTSWDNVGGATSYNLYWKKDKIPNCYFTSLDGWSIGKGHGSETVEISGNKLSLDIDSGIDAIATLEYDYRSLSTNDYDISIDVSDYLVDNNDEGPTVRLGMFSEVNNDYVRIRFWRDQTGSPAFKIKAEGYFAGSMAVSIEAPRSTFPIKLRIKRTGTTFYWYYDVGSGWVSMTNYGAAGAPALDINKILLRFVDNSLYGGSVKLDNLIDIPSVKNSGTKIIGVSNPYHHTGLLEDDIYCYEITAENIDGESGASLEEFGIPFADTLTPPVITGVGDDSQNIINISEIWNATIYNVYWSLVPGVTVNNGTKIIDVTRPYKHIDLIRQNYYYVVTAENAQYESDISNEICLKPDFIGKIFNHNDIIINRLLYQYQIKE